jgi:DNA helicase II / ATP-dependent DNA helicase PcrA
MPSKLIIAAAGSGKTELIVQAALASAKKILIVTYTNENLAVLRERIIQSVGFIPPHIKILSWFSFLLKETVRPYQNILYDGRRICSLNFEAVPQFLKYIPQENTSAYYFTKAGKIYRDRVSNFAYRINLKSSGYVTRRLEKIYDEIYIDEVQDLAGWDLEILDLLMNSNLSLTFVGDIRQATFSTNYSTKNKQYKGSSIIKWFELKEKKGKCSIEYRTESFRCNQIICDFADKLCPDLDKTISQNFIKTGHDGVFLLRSKYIQSYIEKYSPRILRHNKNSQTIGPTPLNFGQAKGQTFDRVLIFPTGPISNYLKCGELFKKKGQQLSPAFDIAKFYVAITRARFSVTIVSESPSCFDTIQHYNDK